MMAHRNEMFREMKRILREEGESPETATETARAAMAYIGLVFSPKIWTLRGTGNFGEKIFPGDSPKFPVYIIA